MSSSETRGSVITRHFRSYVVGDEIGAGAASVVLQGRDRTTGRSAALKIVRIDSKLNRARVLREGYAYLRLGGTTTPQCLEVVVDGDTCVFVLEHIEGTLLADRTMPMDVDAALAMTITVALAVETLHVEGVIHRDIQPWNIIETTQGSIRIIDFGSAWTSEWSDLVTTDVEALGSPGYASPEQLRGCRPTPANDVFSIGTLFVQLLTACQPYGIVNDPRTNAAAIPEVLIGLAKDAPNVPRPLLPVIEQLVNTDPISRIQTAIGAAEALAQHVDEGRI